MNTTKTHARTNKARTNKNGAAGGRRKSALVAGSLAGIIVAGVAIAACGTGTSSGATGLGSSDGSQSAAAAPGGHTAGAARGSGRTGSRRGAGAASGSGAAAPSVAGFSPQLIAAAGSSSSVFVLGTASCGRSSCVELWGGEAEHFRQLTVPPTAEPTSVAPNGSIDELVFANAEDGYAVERSGSGVETTVYETTDGGRSWRLTSVGSGCDVRSMVASGGEFYGLLDSCPAARSGTGWRLYSSVAGSGRSSSIAIAGTTRLVPGDTWIDIAAAGGNVFVDFPRSALSPVPELVESSDGGPFRSIAGNGLTSGEGECSLAATAPETVWAYCPQGMSAIEFVSTDGGQQFGAIWQPSQTGGGAFDPVTGGTAYRWTGEAGFGPLAGRPWKMQVTRDAGIHFSDLGPLPADVVRSAEPALLFGAGPAASGYLVDPVGSVNKEVPALFYTADGGGSWERVSF